MKISGILLFFIFQAGPGFVYAGIIQPFNPAGRTQTKDPEGNRNRNSESAGKRFYFGGMVGLRFGTITDIQLTPMAGYRLTPRIGIGAGFKYQYYSERNPLFKYSTHIFGPRVFARYLFLKSFSNIFRTKFNGGLFFEAEYETLSMEKKYFDFPTYDPEGRFWLKSYLAGIGLREPIDRNRAVNLILLYNLNDVQYTPYSNPMFRIELTF